MKLLVGLGNTGTRYQQNRHNVGFQFLDYLVGHSGSSRISGGSFDSLTFAQDDSNLFKTDTYSESELCEIETNGQKFILAKPQTFMNDSGRAVKKILSHVKCDLSNVYIIHDDLDIPLGQYKIQKGVGPRLHYGIESIEKDLKTKDFWRVRVGVDNRDSDRRIPGEAYVLQNFTQEERVILQHVFENIVSALMT